MISQKQIQALTSFAELLEVLKNPQGFAQTVQEAKELYEKELALLGPKSIVAEAEKYREEMKQNLEKQLRDFQNEVAEFATFKEQKKKELQEQEEQMVNFATKVREEASTLNKERANLVITTLALTNKETSLKMQEEKLHDQEEALKVREQDLAEKSRKIQELIG